MGFEPRSVGTLVVSVVVCSMGDLASKPTLSSFAPTLTLGKCVNMTETLSGRKIRCHFFITETSGEKHGCLLSATALR